MTKSIKTFYHIIGRLVAQIIEQNKTCYDFYARYIKPCDGHIKPYYQDCFDIVVDGAGGCGVTSVSKYIAQNYKLKVSSHNHSWRTVNQALIDGVPCIVTSRDSFYQCRSLKNRFPDFEFVMGWKMFQLYTKIPYCHDLLLVVNIDDPFICDKIDKFMIDNCFEKCSNISITKERPLMGE